MDPLMHLLFPMLFLLAARIDSRKALVFAPLAIVPDFDALFGLHRALGHSFMPVLVLPLAILAYSKLRRPEWLLSATLVLFYLMSHVVLDLGGVAFLWPVVPEQFYFDPNLTFTADGGFGIGFDLDYGLMELEPMGTTSLLSETGFALILLGALMTVVFRREALGALRRAWRTVVETLRELTGR